jgi:predicted nuclease of predicted toxin-antitoxin system
MKFLADMGIPPVTVAWLNQQGHDAKHLSEVRHLSKE